MLKKLLLVSAACISSGVVCAAPYVGASVGVMDTLLKQASIVDHAQQTVNYGGHSPDVDIKKIRSNRCASFAAQRCLTRQLCGFQ